MLLPVAPPAALLVGRLIPGTLAVESGTETYRLGALAAALAALPAALAALFVWACVV